MSGPCFAIPESLIADLHNAGFSALGMANNHEMDLGERGKIRTQKSLRRNQLAALSFEDSPYFRTIHGHTVAFITLSLISGKDGKSQTIPSIELSQKLRLARNFSERTVIFIHWGTELQDWPNGEQIRAAHWLVGHGADLIIG